MFVDCMRSRDRTHYGMAPRPPPIARPSKPMASTTTPSTARIQPIWADIPATPPKPKSAAIMATTKKVTAQLSMVRSSSTGTEEQPVCHDKAAETLGLSVCPDPKLENVPRPICTGFASGPVDQLAHRDQQPAGLERLREERIEAILEAALAANRVGESRHRHGMDRRAASCPDVADERIPVGLGHADIADDHLRLSL